MCVIGLRASQSTPPSSAPISTLPGARQNGPRAAPTAQTGPCRPRLPRQRGSADGERLRAAAVVVPVQVEGCLADRTARAGLVADPAGGVGATALLQLVVHVVRAADEPRALRGAGDPRVDARAVEDVHLTCEDARRRPLQSGVRGHDRPAPLSAHRRTERPIVGPGCRLLRHVQLTRGGDALGTPVSRGRRRRHSHNETSECKRHGRDGKDPGHRSELRGSGGCVDACPTTRPSLGILRPWASPRGGERRGRFPLPGPAPARDLHGVGRPGVCPPSTPRRGA